MVVAPTPLSSSLARFEPVDETSHIGTSFSSDEVQLSAWLAADNSDELIRDLARLVSYRGVVFFKNQDLTIEQQKQHGLRLGQLTGRPAESSLHKHPISEDTPELGADTSVISSMGCVGSYCVTNRSWLIAKTCSGIARAGYVPNVRASNGWHADITFEPFPSDYAVSNCGTSLV